MVPSREGHITVVDQPESDDAVIAALAGRIERLEGQRDALASELAEVQGTLRRTNAAMRQLMGETTPTPSSKTKRRSPPGGVRDRVLAAMTALGRPALWGEIAQQVGDVNPSTVQTTLSALRNEKMVHWDGRQGGAHLWSLGSKPSES
jgi:DNA-binding transcriptional ArsR family regulator